MTLIEFLRARLDEDEALAREAPQGPWHIGNAVDPTQPCNVHTFPDVRLVADGLNWLVAEHIAHHNPARALADVEAKRRIIKEYEDSAAFMSRPEHAHIPAGETHGLYTALRLLAVPHADHPDYRQEWRP